MLRRSILTLALVLAVPSPAQVPQDSVEAEAPPPPVVATTALSIARVAAGKGDQAEALSQYLRVLSTSPNNLEALAGAGRSALAVGDVNAATGFFARAEDLAPNDGAVKAGLGSATVQTGNGRAALRYFRQAQALGVAESSIAEDRGLAYDLNGDSRRAQASYQLALVGHPDNATATRRLALSQAISGNLPLALATLDPLLRKQDIPAWRTRAFAKALTGDVAGAEQDAALVLPQNQVTTLRPYLARLATLKANDKAAAVFLGRFPQPGDRVTVAAATPAPVKKPIFSLPTFVRRTAPAPTIVADASVATAMRADPGPASAAPVAPVPLPAAPPPAEPTVDDSPALRAQMRKVAAAKRADALVAQKKRAELAEAATDAKAAKIETAKTAKANPARHWVQVAGGANKADLPRAWSQLKTKWPWQLSGRSPWIMHYRFTNRLMIGPFPSADAAQDWVGERKKEGLATFRVSTRAGDAVERM